MPPADDRVYYMQLETGARYLASSAGSSAERTVHLGMADKYARLGADSKGGKH